MQTAQHTLTYYTGPDGSRVTANTADKIWVDSGWHPTWLAAWEAFSAAMAARYAKATPDSEGQR